MTQPRLYNLARDLSENEDLATASGEGRGATVPWNSWAAQLKEPSGTRPAVARLAVRPPSRWIGVHSPPRLLRRPTIVGC